MHCLDLNSKVKVDDTSRMKKWLFLFLTIISLVYLMTTQSGLLSSSVVRVDLDNEIIKDKELYSAFEKMTPSPERAPADETIDEPESRENHNDEKNHSASESQLNNFQDEIKSITSIETLLRIKESVINDIRSHNQRQADNESDFALEQELSSVEQLQALEAKLHILEEEIEDRQLNGTDAAASPEDTKYQESYYD